MRWHHPGHGNGDRNGGSSACGADRDHDRESDIDCGGRLFNIDRSRDKCYDRDHYRIGRQQHKTLAATGGTLTVTPAATTTYTATATGAAGTTPATATATVTVTAATTPPTVTVVANPTTIVAGTSSTLTIVATNATSVTVAGSDGTATP